MHILVHFGSAWLVKLDLFYGVFCSESLFCTFHGLFLVCIFCSYLRCKLFPFNFVFSSSRSQTRQKADMSFSNISKLKTNGAWNGHYRVSHFKRQQGRQSFE